MSRYQESRESHLKLVQFIEKATMESAPDVIITHHPADTNNDHLQISMACQEAIQLQQARGEANQGILVYGGA